MHPPTPRFSVVTPTYNRQDVVLSSVDSVRRQEYGDRVEIVVVDDESTDETAARVRSYAQRWAGLRLTYVRSPARAGVAGARNLGIERARGDYLVMLDSDDELMPGALARLDGILSRHDCAVYLGAVRSKAGRALRYDPAWAGRPLTFVDYLRSYEEPEAMAVVRASVLREHRLSYSVDGGITMGFEGLLYLNILKLGYRLYRDSEPVRLYDDVGVDRLNNRADMLRGAERLARGHARMLREFHADMRRFAPRLYWRTLFKAVAYTRVAGVELDPFVARSRLARYLCHVPAPVVRRLVLSYKVTRG